MWTLRIIGFWAATALASIAVLLVVIDGWLVTSNAAIRREVSGRQQFINQSVQLSRLNQELVNELDLPYRVVNVAAGDLGASAAKKYDIEAWFPGQERYREITSTSNTTDYQARRLGIRYRTNSRQLAPVHTLNGTAVTARAMIALMENFQEEDGSIRVPDVLHELGAPRKLGAERATA